MKTFSVLLFSRPVAKVVWGTDSDILFTISVVRLSESIQKMLSTKEHVDLLSDKQALSFMTML